MNRMFAHLPIFLITATWTLGIGQPYTTGDHSYKTELEVECHLGWWGTVNNQKNVPGRQGAADPIHRPWGHRHRRSSIHIGTNKVTKDVILCKMFYSAYIEVQTRAINITLTLWYVTIPKRANCLKNFVFFPEWKYSNVQLTRWVSFFIHFTLQSVVSNRASSNLCWWWMLECNLCGLFKTAALRAHIITIYVCKYVYIYMSMFGRNNLVIFDWNIC